jgi:type I restriction enzyme M protein
MKRMINVFEKYKYRHDVTRIFEMFLEFVITGFDQTFSPIEKPLSQEDGQMCIELMNAWILTMNEKLKSKEWYDALGEIYMEYISGGKKKQSTGQFFTPMYICDFMTKIVNPGEKSGESVMDNACGSGRMLLASHSQNLGNYCCAQDMDRICCLMTVCNFIIHGVNGEVVWGNSLDPSDYRDGWKTNELLNVIGVPCVRKMDMMESRTYRSGLLMLQQKSGQEELPENKPTNTSPQLSLFDDYEYEDATE